MTPPAGKKAAAAAAAAAAALAAGSRRRAEFGPHPPIVLYYLPVPSAAVSDLTTATGHVLDQILGTIKRELALVDVSDIRLMPASQFTEDLVRSMGACQLVDGGCFVEDLDKEQLTWRCVIVIDDWCRTQTKSGRDAPAARVAAAALVRDIPLDLYFVKHHTSSHQQQYQGGGHPPTLSRVIVCGSCKKAYASQKKEAHWVCDNFRMFPDHHFTVL